MAEHEKAGHKNQDKLEQKHRHGQNDSQPLSYVCNTWDEGFVSIGETPFQPQVEKHTTLLTMAHSDKQRASVTMQLQQNYGNKYVQRLIELMKVQAKLTVNPPGDIYEQEADKVADTVVNSPSSHIHRQKENEEEEKEQEIMPVRTVVQRQEEEKESVQTKSSENKLQMVPEDLESQINVARGYGHPLSDSVRAFVEPQFGYDFGDVNVHTNTQADKLAKQLGAQAFTTGRDIFFREGDYQPHSESGQKLITHELTHVVQQGTPTRIYRQNQKSKGFSKWGLAEKAKAAKSRNDLSTAKTLYRQAIIDAAAAVTPPTGVEKIQPKAEDINIDWNFGDDAETQGKKVYANENNYWLWFRFGPTILRQTKTHTEATILHEMIHVRQYKKMLANYRKDTSPNKGSWDDYRKRQSPRARVLGPEEMEAHITSLDYLKRMSPAEQEQHLRGIFTSYALTTKYKPPKGVKLEMSAAAAKPLIENFYQNADEKLKQLMGSMLWKSLIALDSSKATWIRVIRDLKDIAKKGYSDKAYQASYDGFLEMEGLKFRDIIGASGSGAIQREIDNTTGITTQSPPTSVQMKESPEDEELQTKVSGAQSETDNRLAEQMNTSRGIEIPLSDTIIASLEPQFGHDFNDVKAHTDNHTDDNGQKPIVPELTPVMHQDSRPNVLARQKTKKYETKGIKLDVAQIAEWGSRSYWEEKIRKVLRTNYIDPTTARFNANKEERDAVLSVLWDVRPKRISTETTRIVTIPRRTTAKSSKDLIYRFIFKPSKEKGKKPLVIVDFVSEAGATKVTGAVEPKAGFTPKSYGPIHSRFPKKDIDKYWKKHPEEHKQLYNWIQNVAGRTFDQVVTTKTTVKKGKSTITIKASFKVRGKKNTSGDVTSLRIDYLGAAHPKAEAPAAGYAGKDFTDLAIEEQQTKKHPGKKDKLGTISGVSTLPKDEQLPVKYAIWQYFRQGTRNSEVDAIIPIPDKTGKKIDINALIPGKTDKSKKVLYTLQFEAKTNNVVVKRIGEEGKGVSLTTPKLDVGNVKGFDVNSKNAATLIAWLKKRYPSTNPRGKTVDEVRKNANAELKAGADKPDWFKNNYGIEILDGASGATRLKTAHKYLAGQVVNMKNFDASELVILESALETMSDKIISTFKDIRMVRQEIIIDKVLKKGSRVPTLVPRPKRTGIYAEMGSNRTVIISDSANMNASALFIGGKSTGGMIKVHQTTTMVFSHELGHAIHEEPGVKKAFSEFVKAKKIKPITWYAGTKPKKELFPEAFALYGLDPKWLKANWPALYSWFDTLSKTGKPPP